MPDNHSPGHPPAAGSAALQVRPSTALSTYVQPVIAAAAEDDDAIHLRVLQHRVGIGVAARLRAQHDAKADIAVDLMVADEIGLAQGIEQPMGNAVHIVGPVQLVEHDHEFVAADPSCHLAGFDRASQHIAATQDRAQPVGHQTEHLVADAVAQSVVDLLESIAIDEHDGEVVAGVARRALQRRFDQLANGRAVGHTGETVGTCGIPEAPGQSLLLALCFGRGIGQHRHQA